MTEQWDNPDWTGWPAVEGDEAAQAVFKGKVEARSARIKASIDRAAAEHAADLAQNADFQQALLDIAKGGIERARHNAETVQRAAGVIGTLYTGVLAAAFSVSSRPLPARGVLAALFLGLAVALSTAYLAYLNRQASGATMSFGADADPHGMRGQLLRVNLLTRLVSAAVRRRSYLMRCAVLALAVGVVCLPLGFLAMPWSSPGANRVPDWPAPAAGVTDPELAKIRYTAEVSEAAKRREKAMATETDPPAVLITLTVTGLAIVFAGGWLDRQSLAPAKASRGWLDVSSRNRARPGDVGKVDDARVGPGDQP